MHVARASYSALTGTPARAASFTCWKTGAGPAEVESGRSAIASCGASWGLCCLLQMISWDGRRGAGFKKGRRAREGDQGWKEGSTPRNQETVHQQDRPAVLLQSLLTSPCQCPWAKQTTWPNGASLWVGTTQGCESWEE